MQARSDHHPESAVERAPDHDSGHENDGASVWSSPYRAARRIGVAVVGSTVLLVGVVLLVTPGPAFVVIPIGLGILSIEFAWARRWLDKVKQQASKVVGSGDKHAA